MKDPIRLSIALLTRNNPASLQRALDSIRSQDYSVFEIVVSDDSDPEWVDETERIVMRFGGKLHRGPHNGLYANRNHCFSLCSGTHIRTMDDDHVMPPGHLNLCMSALQNSPRMIWTTGERSFVDGEYYGFTPVATQLHPSGVGESPKNLDRNWAISDGSSFYPREVFSSGNRMVEEFGYGSSYLEFGAFLFANGYPSRCVRGAFVEHHASSQTLNRSNLGIQCGRLFASLAFNLYFVPNFLLAAKHVLSIVFLQPFGRSIIREIPRVVSAVKRRWRTLGHFKRGR